MSSTNTLVVANSFAIAKQRLKSLLQTHAS